MNLLNLAKEAGEKIFNSVAGKEDPATAVMNHIKGMGLEGAENISLTLSEEGQATVTGSNIDPQQKNKILMAVGNITGVASVIDNITVSSNEDQAHFYTVVAGDNLSNIAQKVYNNANRYMDIFEANKPMLSSPDRIYPGQVLIIPVLAE